MMDKVGQLQMLLKAICNVVNSRPLYASSEADVEPTQLTPNHFHLIHGHRLRHFQETLNPSSLRIARTYPHYWKESQDSERKLTSLIWTTKINTEHNENNVNIVLFQQSANPY